MLCFLIALFAQADTVYNLRDFRIPEAGAMKLALDASVGLDGRQGFWQDTLSRELYLEGSASAYSGIHWDLKLLGEKRYMDISSFGQLGSSISSYKLEEHTDTLDTTRTERYFEASGNLHISSDMGWYLKESPWFLGFSGDFHGWPYARYSSYLDDEVEFFSLELEGGFFVGGGVGKIRNVRPVVDAWQFLEEIGQASRSSIQNLAEILATQWSYELRYWRYEKYFYSDVEKVLAEKGDVTRLSPYEVMRLREIIAYIPDSRLYGVRLSTQIGARASNHWLVLLVNPGLRISLTGGYPLSRRWQIGGYASGEFLFPELADLEYEITVDGYVHYYLGERWRIESDMRAEYFGSPGWMTSEKYRRIDIIFSPLSLYYYADEKLVLWAGLNYALASRESSNEHSGWFHDLQLSAGFVWRLR